MNTDLEKARFLKKQRQREINKKLEQERHFLANVISPLSIDCLRRRYGNWYIKLPRHSYIRINYWGEHAEKHLINYRINDSSYSSLGDALKVAEYSGLRVYWPYWVFFLSVATLIVGINWLYNILKTQ